MPFTLPTGEVIPDDSAEVIAARRTLAINATHPCLLYTSPSPRD